MYLITPGSALYHVCPSTYDIVDHCIAFSQLPITHYQPQQI
ncbi:MAG: hypothetical protein ACK57R_08435 [Dolichospermum sp.]